LPDSVPALGVPMSNSIRLKTDNNLRVSTCAKALTEAWPEEEVVLEGTSSCDMTVVEHWKIAGGVGCGVRGRSGESLQTEKSV
jgi:hypothetical protein